MTRAEIMALLKQGGAIVPVIGDVMLDRYWYGSTRLVPGEGGGKVIAYHVEEKHNLLGGAANVSSNLARLGANTCLYGVIGLDDAGRDLQKILERSSINCNLCAFKDRQTTVKLRIGTLGGDLTDVRVDVETVTPITESQARELAKNITRTKKNSVLVVSDYAKGVITPTLLGELRKIREAKGITVVIDPKPLGGMRTNLYKGFDWVTPNLHELGEMVGSTLHSHVEIEEAANEIAEQLGCNVLVTMGKDGMMLLERGKIAQYVGGLPVSIANTIGAGDTAIATFALCLAAGAPALIAAQVANVAASIAVSKHETDAVGIDELQKVLDSG